MHPANSAGACNMKLDSRTLGRSTNKILKPVGLRITTAEAPREDYIDSSCDPLLPSYTSQYPEYVVQVPLETCRGIHPAFFSFPPNAANPYTETLRRFELGILREYKDSPLEQHYSSWQPRNAAEAIGLNSAECHEAIRNASPFDFVFPWETIGPSSVRRRQKTEKENLKFGLPLSSTDGFKGFGPVSAEKGSIEFGRFTQVYSSIREHGYKRSGAKDGDLRGRILRYRDKSVVLITTGGHRLTALSALKYKQAPVRICWCPVYRDDVDIWPNVSANLFTKKQALNVFDRVFNGEWPNTLGYAANDDLCALTIDV